MKNKEIQKIHSRFTKNLLTIHGVVFLSLVGIMVASTYLLKRELADQVGRTIEGKIKSGDTREIVNILSDAKTHDFRAVELFDQDSISQLTLPARFKRNVSSFEYFWRKLTLATYKKEIYFDHGEKEIAATIVFTFGIFQLFPMAVLVFALGLLATFPLVVRYKGLLLDSWEKETIKREKESIAELARQVRHDYKSPLMAIKSVIDKAKGLKPLEKKTISIAYHRMISMLGDLSKENLEKNPTEDKQGGLTHVYSSLLSVVEEKLAYLSKGEMQGTSSNVMIKILCSEDDRRAYIPIEDMELQRVISNLLENSIESVKGFKNSGEVLIRIDAKKSVFKIEIEDNGKGIPKEALESVGTKGFSFGKKEGEGLGVYSAIKKIETWGGSLRIDSTQGMGTRVIVELPNAIKPEWARVKINLEGMESIVILDDDKSIHQMWSEKLRQKALVIYNFTNAEKFLEKVDRFGRKTLFLLDHELRGQKQTGLDVAKNLLAKGLFAKKLSSIGSVSKDSACNTPCYLVTNNFQDPWIQQ